MTASSKKPPELWIEEDQYGVLRSAYRVKQPLFSGESDYQNVDIVETHGFGRMLLNDSVVMVSERDERIYHEMIGHVPMFVSPGIERVLVIGGGDGGTVREILRHPAVKHCRLVEIDRLVVDACRRHLPQTAAALDDPRVELAFEDGVKYVARTDDVYDLVVVDSSDPVGPAAPLFGAEFYSSVQRILADDGIVVSQADSPFFGLPQQESLLRILRGLFRRVQIYNYSNMTYPGGLWSFTFAGKGDICPVGDLDDRRVKEAGLSFHYYNPAVHRAAFVHPEFQAARLGGLLTPVRST